MRQKLIGTIIGTWTGWRVLRLLLIAYGTLAFYGFFLAERQIFLPPTPTYSANDEILKIPVTAQDSVAAFYLPNPSSDWVILYSHGNGEDLGMVRPVAQRIAQAGYSVLAYDYRGYGLSSGPRPSERKTYGDIEAVYRYAVEELKIDPHRLVIQGRSVGGGPSVYLATRHPVAGLIVESSFVSIFRVVTRIPILPFDKFPSLARIRQIRCPVLIIHGTQDDVIPLWHGQQLYGAVRSPKQVFWVEGADHNDLMAVAGDRYLTALGTFQTLLTQPPGTEKLNEERASDKAEQK